MLACQESCPNWAHFVIALADGVETRSSVSMDGDCRFDLVQDQVGLMETQITFRSSRPAMFVPSSDLPFATSLSEEARSCHANRVSCRNCTVVTQSECMLPRLGSICVVITARPET